eukprot:1158726-Pelagomonas_calceolata.AAC.8
MGVGSPAESLACICQCEKLRDVGIPEACSYSSAEHGAGGSAAVLWTLSLSHIHPRPLPFSGHTGQVGLPGRAWRS